MSTEDSPLAKHGKWRTDEVTRKLEKAKRAIEADIEKSGAIYPYNGGRLSEAEVCRRAGINPVTLLGKKHVQTRKALKEWLAKLHASISIGSDVVRAEVTRRADDWKARYEAIATSMHLLKLEDVSRQIKLAEALERVSELESQIASSIQHEGGADVVCIRCKTSPGGGSQ